ncbi:MAG: dockerin type I domain-containing protein [Candidatus Zixiibacteriota bacterium]
MKRLLQILGVISIASVTASADQRFVRGDVNCDGVVDTTDALAYSDFFEFGSPVPPCLKTSDVNADGIPLTSADLVYLLRVINGDVATLPPPFPFCGTDTLDVECEVSCCPSPRFIRGDIDCDGAVDSADIIAYESFFTNAVLPPCQKTTDVNADGIPLTNSDLVLLIRYINGDDSTLPAPYPECGTDTSDISCEATCCTPEKCSCAFQADPDSSSGIDSADLSVMIDCVYFACNPMPQEVYCPGPQMDFNCDGYVDSVDLAEMVDHVYFAGPGPCNPCDCALYPVNCP